MRQLDEEISKAFRAGYIVAAEEFLTIDGGYIDFNNSNSDDNKILNERLLQYINGNSQPTES
jgi:hypothetical protein